MKQKITMEEIASVAGVSVATVSRVLNNRSNTSKSAATAVNNALIKLGYKKSEVKKNTSKDILMLVPKISNPFYAPIFDGAQETAAKYGYRVLLDQVSPKMAAMNENGLIPISDRSFAGLLLLQGITAEMLEKYRRFNIPIVQCCEYTENCDTTYVSIDDIASAQNAIEYLISIGRTRIALINSSLNLKYARHREKGFRAAMENASLPINESWICHFSDVSFDMAFPSIMQMLQNKDRPNAIFAVSDVFAAAALKAASRLGLNVPHDVAIIGFDNTEISQMTVPSITTVNQPRYQLGSIACSMLIDKITNPDIPSQQLLLDTHLIVRESTML